MEVGVVEKIIERIAVAEGTSPDDLDVTLQNWVEVDAIHQLVEHDSNSWELQFEVRNHCVTVTGDGAVLVDGVREPPFLAN